MKKVVLGFLFAIVAAAAWAKPQMVTLDLPAMNCAMCPVTIQKALFEVEGVEKVDIRYAHRRAVVTYDDAKTTVADLVRATTNAGYPSAVI